MPTSNTGVIYDELHRGIVGDAAGKHGGQGVIYTGYEYINREYDAKGAVVTQPIE